MSDWKSGEGKWPRAKGDDWRETLQTGDIVECKDEYEKWYETLVRYVYPKEHKTMAGKCIIHYIGWNIKWDEPLDIDSDRIAKRYTNHWKPCYFNLTEQIMLLKKGRPSNRVTEQNLSGPGRAVVYYNVNE